MSRGKRIPLAVRKKQIEELVKGSFPEEEVAIIGENRGQLFVRIPKLVTQRLGLEKGQEMVFRVSSEGVREHKLEVEVVKRA